MSTIAKFLAQPPDGFSTQIASSTVSSTDLSVNLDSVTGLPTEGVGQFFKKDSNGDLVSGTVEFVHWTNVSGNTLTFSDTGDRGITGSDSGAQSYVADDYFEVWASSYYVGGIGGLIEHDADGTHSSGNTYPSPVFTGDVNLSGASDNIQVNSADPKRAFYIPANGMFGATTSGAASGQGESSSNKVNYKTLDFDTSSDEYACFSIAAPYNWDLSTVTATFYWTSAGATPGQTVTWAIQGLALSNDDAIDTAYGTAQTVADTLIATNDIHVTSATSAITLAGTPAAGDWINFRVYRDVSEDNISDDARLICVRIEFGVSKYSDVA